MMDESPSYLQHCGWVDKLVTTPSPCKHTGQQGSYLLTDPPSGSEHVLRFSKSFAARSYRSRPTTDANTFRTPSDSSNKENQPAAKVVRSEEVPPSRASHLEPPASKIFAQVPPLHPVAPNGQTLHTGLFRYRRSPTPSLRRQRAEAIVKAHGSPTHIRVTAGGRIVPKDQSPLCHPRYGYSAVKVNGGLIKFAPNHPTGKAQWTQPTQSTADGMLAQDPDGRLCQIVSGQIMPLVEVDGMLRLHMPAPNLSVTQAGPPFQQPWQHRAPSTDKGFNAKGLTLPPPSSDTPMLPPDPSIAQQQSALELEYSKLEQELRELDKAEVIHGRTMGKVARDALVGKRRELVTTMDRVRKAIKNLKDMPPPTAPASPRGTPIDTQLPSPRNRLPAFLHSFAPNDPAHVNLAPQATSFGHPWYAPPLQPPASECAASFGYNAVLPPAGMFVPSPPLDGSITTPLVPFGEQTSAVLPLSVPRNRPAVPGRLPQTDGSCSVTDTQLPNSPRQSHALPIKAPDGNLVHPVKTKLNPMSPEYTPGGSKQQNASHVDALVSATKGGKARIALSSLPVTSIKRKANSASSEAASPGKKAAHVQKSSGSSYNTADFFPRDTQEYSTRRHEYRESMDCSSDKENMDPDRLPSGGNSTHSTPPRPRGHPEALTDLSPTKGGFQAPPAPPGTPVDPGSTVSSQNRSMAGNVGSLQRRRDLIDPMMTRKHHNISPKNKRHEWIFVQESPEQDPSHSSSPSLEHQYNGDNCVTVGPYGDYDTANKSKDWIHGFEAGLHRKPVGQDRTDDFLSGYCNGLMSSQTATTTLSSIEGGRKANGSPSKPVTRRPSPAAMSSQSSSERLRTDRRDFVAPRPTLETSVQSSDTLKQAVFAPQNENAVLTPAADGPHVSQVPFQHVNWTRDHKSSDATEKLVQSLRMGDGMAGFPFPDRTSSIKERRKLPSEASSTSRDTNNTGVDPLQRRPPATAAELPGVPSSPRSGSAGDMQSSSIGKAPTSFTSRTTSMPTPHMGSTTSLDFNPYRAYPGHRTFSPYLEYRSLSSVSNAATGFAAGTFAQPQVDGSSHDNLFPMRAQMSARLTQPFDSAGTQQSQLSGGFMPPVASRFKEISLDGMSSPPKSPPLSPKSTPIDEKRREGGTKSPSPTKQKFEQLAGKVGIKITTTAESEKQHRSESEPTTPQGKRRWRDLWKNARKDTHANNNNEKDFT